MKSTSECDLKLDSHLRRKLVLSASIEGLQKCGKMLFISCRKLFSFSKYLDFCPNFFGHVGKPLDKKAISKFMMPQTGKQIITIHILPNISRSKGNQAMEFYQLIEYNITNIFLEKAYTKCGGKLVQHSFLKN